MNGELKSMEREENGRKVLYVEYDGNAPTPKVETVAENNEEIDYKKAYEDLNKEYLILKTKYEKLLNS